MQEQVGMAAHLRQIVPVRIHSTLELVEQPGLLLCLAEHPVHVDLRYLRDGVRERHRPVFRDRRADLIRLDLYRVRSRMFA